MALAPNVLDKRLLDLIEPAPALVLNRVSDLLAWTTGYERLGAPTGILAADRPNFARYTFLDERARVTYPDWERVADEQVAQLRVGMRYGEQASIELVADPSIEPGGCILEAGSTRVDAQLGPALRRARQALLS